MSEKLNLKAVSLSLGLLFSVIYAICGLFYAITPKFTMAFFDYLFHSGVVLQEKSLTLSGFAIGLVEMFISGAAIGAIFVSIYNYLLEK